MIGQMVSSQTNTMRDSWITRRKYKNLSLKKVRTRGWTSNQMGTSIQKDHNMRMNNHPMKNMTDIRHHLKIKSPFISGQ
jgi:hypothetical protein